jgi:nitrogen regulatory protein PII
MFQRIRKAIHAPGVKHAVMDDVTGSGRQGDLIQRKPSLA